MEKIIVDENVCIGCGFCAASSDVFDINDENVAFTKENMNLIDDMSEEKKEEVLEVKDGCPVEAIKIVEE